jgi:alpha-beta hydrolase superfamily lysophospholipase
VRFSGRDGFPLSGVVLTPPLKTRSRAAVLLIAPGDTVADYDSLGLALERAGVAVMLMDVRGSGGSVAPVCPLPDTWEGRQERLHALTARDVRDALRALARVASIDTSRYLVGGIGSTASIAVEAAEIDRRVRALLLVSPKPASVDRGPMRARLTRLRLPVFFQSGSGDFESAPLTEALYQAGNRGSSRVAEARAADGGAAQFQLGPSVSARFIRWLDEMLPRPSGGGLPPSTRRRGSPPPPTTIGRESARRRE